METVGGLSTKRAIVSFFGFKLEIYYNSIHFGIQTGKYGVINEVFHLFSDLKARI